MRDATMLLLLALSQFFAAGAHAQNPRVVERRIHSAELGDERTLRISLPTDYDAARRRYPVVYLLDGELPALFGLTVGAAAFDMQLDAFDRALPPQIVVGIVQKDRGQEFGDSSSRFLRFLRQEAVPAVEREFRASPFRIIVGHSLGGRIALMALCDDRRFAAAIAASPALDSTDARRVTACLTRRFSADSGRLTQLVFSSGERDRDATEAGFRPGIAALAEFLHASAPSAVRWKHVTLPDISHSQTPFFTIPDGLWFVHDRSVWDLPASTYESVFGGKVDFVDAYGEFATRLARRVGFAAAPDAKWLRIAALTRTRPADAVEAGRLFAREYPEMLDAHLGLADALKAVGDTAGARRELGAAAALRTRRRR